jgi:hypothetical protein
MKKTLTILLLFAALSAHCQNPITANGFKFKQGNKTFSFKELAGVVQNNKLANEKYWEARTKRTNSLILAGFGAVGIGIPVYTVIKRGSASWFFTRYTMPLMAGGIICEVAAIKKSTKAKALASEAASIYNASIKTSYHYKPKPELFVGMTTNGPGIQIKF